MSGGDGVICEICGRKRIGFASKRVGGNCLRIDPPTSEADQRDGLAAECYRLGYEREKQTNTRLQGEVAQEREHCADSTERAALALRRVAGLEEQNTRLWGAVELASLQCSACHGKGWTETACSRCGDSTDDHWCDDERRDCYACAPLRALLAERKATSGNKHSVSAGAK